jgi:hypothetical protein
MTMFANLRRDLVLLPVVLAALVAAAAAGGQQPRGELCFAKTGPAPPNAVRVREL